MLWAHMAAKALVKASDDLTSKEMTSKMKRKRSFWKWLILWARAGVMAEARKKRILRENLATWNHYNRDFIRKCEKEDAKAASTLSNDEYSTVGFYGGDSGDGLI